MRGHKLAGIIVIIIGLSVLFSFPIFNFIFAIILLSIGVRILTGHRIGNWSEVGGIIKEDYLHRVLIFSRIKAKLETKNFEGMELVTIFGGGEIDAGDVFAKKGDVDIDLVAIFGGVKIKIPKGWAVKSEGVGIVGGFDNKTNASSKPEVTVHLKGVAIFGGVEVVN